MRVDWLNETYGWPGPTRQASPMARRYRLHPLHRETTGSLEYDFRLRRQPPQSRPSPEIPGPGASP